MLLCCITLSSSRENQRSAQEVARRISGAVAGEVYAKVNIPSTHHKHLSPALHYFPFASRFPLPHFTLVLLFALFSSRLSFAMAESKGARGSFLGFNALDSPSVLSKLINNDATEKPTRVVNPYTESYDSEI